ncbi:TetR/AcrR family transcriptional regulator [Nocardia sp. NPDC004711]
MESAAERLIVSTRELLWERGYVGTSPRLILERAGVGQGSMYHHFRGKPDLARVAIARTTTAQRGEVEKLFAAEGAAIDRIAAYLERDRDVLKGCPVGRLTQDPEVVAESRLREPIAETFDWLCDLLAQVLIEGIAAGELNPDLDPQDTAATLVATMQGGYVLARAAQDPQRFDQAVQGVLNLLRAQRKS